MSTYVHYPFTYVYVQYITIGFSNKYDFALLVFLNDQELSELCLFSFTVFD